MTGSCILDKGESKIIHDGFHESSFAENHHHHSSPVSQLALRRRRPHSKPFVEEYVRCYALNLPPPKLTKRSPPLLSLFPPPPNQLVVRRRQTSISSSSLSSSSSSTSSKRMKLVRGKGCGTLPLPPISLSHLTAPPLTAKECLLLSSRSKTKTTTTTGHGVYHYKPYHSLEDPSTLALLGDRKRYRPLLRCRFRHHQHHNNNNGCYYNPHRHLSSGGDNTGVTSTCCCYSITTVQTPTVYVGETIPMTIVVAQYLHHRYPYLDHHHHHRRRRRRGRGHRSDWEYLKERFLCACQCLYRKQQQDVVELQRSQTGRLV